MNRQKTEKVTVTRSLLQRFAAAPYTVWAVLFIVIPLIFVAYYAFTDRDFAFTLDNIKAFFTPKYMTILWRSVKLAVIATVICLLIFLIRLPLFVLVYLTFQCYKSVSRNQRLPLCHPKTSFFGSPDCHPPFHGLPSRILQPFCEVPSPLYIS